MLRHTEAKPKYPTTPEALFRSDGTKWILHDDTEVSVQNDDENKQKNRRIFSDGFLNSIRTALYALQLPPYRCLAYRYCY